jgi:hypothetical protein
MAIAMRAVPTCCNQRWQHTVEGRGGSVLRSRATHDRIVSFTAKPHRVSARFCGSRHWLNLLSKSDRGETSEPQKYRMEPWH